MSTQVISFNCLLKNKAGQVLSTTFNRDVLNSPDGEGVALKSLAQGMQNLKEGERRSIALSAEDAYGLYDPKKVILFARKKLPSDLKVGMMVSIRGKSGKIRSYTVLQIMDSFVSLDGNHPLAGQDLIFEIEALSVREASAQEIEEAVATAPAALVH